jgi:hypothetical protein
MAGVGRSVGRKVWAIAEGWIPEGDGFDDRALASHETACILNAGDSDAHIELTVFFADREPVRYALMVPARRTKHVRFDDLTNPSVPRGADYASLFVSDVPVVVQHTRLDSRKAEIALMTTVAYGEG